MITRRDFIKGMGALALIPLIPAMADERGYMAASDIIRARAEMIEHMKLKWDNTGTMTTPIDGTWYEVDYTVTPDETIVDEIREVD